MSRPAAAPDREPPPAAPGFARDAAIFFAAALLLCTANLGGTTLAPLDDCFYAAKAREMAAHPGMTVTWAERPAFQNPPGQLWLMAAAMRIFGANDFAARLPAALMTLGTLAGTAWIGARLLSPLAGLAGAALLAVSPLFLHNARRAMLDTPALFWTVAALAAVVAWRRRPAAILLFAPALAMAILTKSVLGLAALDVALVAALLFREWRPLFRDPRFWLAAAAGVALGASWALHQWRTHGAEFLEVHFVREIATRSLEDVGFAKRLLGYPAVLLSQFQPVILLALPGAWWLWTRHPATAWLPFRAERRASGSVPGVVKGRRWGADAAGSAPARPTFAPAAAPAFPHAGATALLSVWALLPIAIALSSAAQSARYVYAILPALALLAGAWLAGRWPGFTRLLAARVVPALMIAGAAIFWLRPEILTRDVNRPFRDAASDLAARARPGTEVTFFGDDYWRAANPLLWYDGLRLGASASSPAEAVARARTANGLLLVERGMLGELPPAIRGSRSWIETSEAVLIDLTVVP